MFIESHNNCTVDTNVLGLPRDQEIGAISQLNPGVKLLQAQPCTWKESRIFIMTASIPCPKVSARLNFRNRCSRRGSVSWAFLTRTDYCAT